MIKVLEQEIIKKYEIEIFPYEKKLHIHLKDHQHVIAVLEKEEVIEVRWLVFRNLAFKTAKINKESFEISYSEFNQETSEGKEFVEITEEVKRAMRPNSLKFIDSL